MAKPTTSEQVYPEWLQEWQTKHAKPRDELLAYNTDEAIANLEGCIPIIIFSVKTFAIADEGFSWDDNKGITYQILRSKWQRIGRKQPLHLVGKDPQSAQQLETSPFQPERETCKERKWYVAKDANGEWYVRKGPVFVIGPTKDVDITMALDTLAIIHVDGGFGHPDNRAFLRQMGEDLYVIGEQIEPGFGGPKTLWGAYNIAKEVWSPDALVLESIWQGVGGEIARCFLRCQREL